MTEVGYELAAVIAAESVLRATFADLIGTKIVPIEQGLALLPITDEFFDSVTDPGAPEAADFWKLPRGFPERLASWSVAGPIAYVEADFFGGTGSQSAQVWANAATVFGPVHLAEGEPTPKGGTPISQALRHLGVRRGGRVDEFEGAGLDRHRHLEDWLT